MSYNPEACLLCFCEDCLEKVAGIANFSGVQANSYYLVLEG